MLVLLPVFLMLGFWQLNRAEEKRLLQQAFLTRSIGPPMPVAEVLMQDWSKLRYQKLILKGYFDNQHHLLLDNQIERGRVGYHVITPLLLPSGQRLLVNRGWIPLGTNRQILPVIEPVNEPVIFQGLLQFIDPNPFILKEIPDEPVTWPWRVQAVNISKIQEQVGGELLPFMVLLLPDEPHGFTRDWHPVAMLPEKHQAYAFQWFALAVTLVIIFIVMNVRREK